MISCYYGAVSGIGKICSIAMFFPVLGDIFQEGSGTGSFSSIEMFAVAYSILHSVDQLYCHYFHSPPSAISSTVTVPNTQEKSVDKRFDADILNNGYGIE
uniref:Uncharacterized protein n=1 Tax=Photinus pyralis TaxID=7054 RepID=A0A1Y1M9U7_PHOPY